MSARPRTARTRVAYLLGTWFGCGYVPYAPGTAGTLGAVPLYLLLRPYGGGVVFAVASPWSGTSQRICN